ncbi:MAG: PRC-barrel domain-containing protein [Halomonas sp.]|nr:DUF6470 family protein [Halomonas sp.]MCC5881154.1 PRC-barrel domain-containing protein [Halomonas sp.]
MKRTAIAIAVGALSTGLSYGVMAQEEEAQLGEQQGVEEQERAGEPGETGFDPQGQGQQPYGDDDNGNDDGLDNDADDNATANVQAGETDVQVDQEPAEIEVEQEPPEVTVEQQAPDVTIEQPEPDVQVDQAEPNVTIEQEGEADVQVEEAEDASAEIRQADDEDADDQRDEGGQDQANRESIEVSELENRDVVNQDGEELGDIDRVVRHIESQDTYVIVTEGGFLGFGEDEMAYPIENLEIRSEGEVVLQSQSGERSTDEFDDDDYEELDGDEQIEIIRVD